jgi:hypothetical protein
MSCSRVPKLAYKRIGMHLYIPHFIPTAEWSTLETPLTKSTNLPATILAFVAAVTSDPSVIATAPNLLNYTLSHEHDAHVPRSRVLVKVEQSKQKK